MRFLPLAIDSQLKVRLKRTHHTIAGKYNFLLQFDYQYHFHSGLPFILGIVLGADAFSRSGDLAKG